MLGSEALFWFVQIWMTISQCSLDYFALEKYQTAKLTTSFKEYKIKKQLKH